MAKIIKANIPLVRAEIPRAEALKMFEEKNEKYKVELINDLPEDAIISTYTQGDFTDLCAGPHCPSTGRVKAFKLQSIAGAYWRGDEHNKMLQRIYGTAFPSKEELDAYLHMLEEAAKRDHRKLGKELDLFSIQDEGPGFPFFHPNGMIIKNTLIDYWREVHRRYGYYEIQTPMILSRTLWERSGHWDHYRDNMYFTKIDEADYAVKPMNCPGGMLFYRTHPHSYRELPLRVGELGLVHRHELSGALHGLFRVRCFTQDDAHIFMMPEQIRMTAWVMTKPGKKQPTALKPLWKTLACRTLLTKATAHSTARKLTSTLPTPSDVPGSAAPFSLICCCRKNLI